MLYLAFSFMNVIDNVVNDVADGVVNDLLNGVMGMLQRLGAAWLSILYKK